VAILVDCDPPSKLRHTAERILANMGTPFEADGHTIVPHVTIGGALYGRDGGDIDTLRQNADLALYRSKESGRGRFIEYSAPLRASVTRRIQRINEVEAALNEGRVAPHYQPVVRLDTGQIVGVEALARLTRHDGGTIAAEYFQEALSEPRIGCRLTDKMLQRVATDVRSWLDRGIPFQHVGVNVSMADFQYDDLAGRMADAFGAVGVPLDHVVLEVTETVFVGGSEKGVAPAVERLRHLGLRVALDDFGTGYASLTHLLTFPVDIIKIDKSFVARLTGDSAGGVIVAALIDIARKLGMRVVAEGIETTEQAERLLDLGCMLGQGFLYYRAASFEETTRRLLDGAQGLRAQAEFGLSPPRRVA
jgi:EAL domain-containing protein (putative c-di-GMP-specific phosphodiesterase class I)